MFLLKLLYEMATFVTKFWGLLVVFMLGSLLYIPIAGLIPLINFNPSVILLFIGCSAGFMALLYISFAYCSWYEKKVN